eukprot:Em0008g40a
MSVASFNPVESVPDPEAPQDLSLPVSLPISFPLGIFHALEANSSCQLGRRLLKLSALPLSWVIASQSPVVLCKIQVQDGIKPTVLMSVLVKDEMLWAVTILNTTFTVDNFPLTNSLPPKLFTVSDVLNLISVLDFSKFCIGDRVGYIDDTLLPQTPTIRHRDCCLLLQQDARAMRCSPCSTYRSTLYIQAKKGRDEEGSSVTVNYRFLQLPELVERLERLHHSYRSLLKTAERLQKRIEDDTRKCAVVLDEESETYINDTIASPESEEYFKKLPPDSFQHLFWQQQVEAASRAKSSSMRWHPLMIRFCLYLRHKCAAYEALRESGAIKLPSQRTLRDYTHYVKASSGFSYEVDLMVRSAANVDTCSEREKYVLLLIDEMYVREDLVFDRYTGKIIGFANMGDINNHLAKLEASLVSGDTSPPLAKTMVVIMIRGIFSKLQYPYAQFPCCALSGDQLYDPFWEAVGRVENCGLKCRGKIITWDHLRWLYNVDTAQGAGLRLLPKLKLEHVNLTPFSKMRVDLAAQVLSASVSKGLVQVCGDDATETAHLAEMMDKFFDALNVHNYNHGAKSRKSFQLPYTSGEDHRLKWLESDFLKYLEDWKISVMQRTGYSKAEKNKMLLSDETRYGLEMTCKSFIELVQFIFTVPSVDSFLSQRICQDPLERFFGLQRQRGGVHENPNVFEFTTNTQALRVVNSFCHAPYRGNCRSGPSEQQEDALHKPLSKRPRTSSITSDQADSLSMSSFSETISSDIVICVAINAMVADKSFGIQSSSAISALNTARALVKWIPKNINEVESLQTQLQDILSPCIQSLSSSSTANATVRAKMWSKYHAVRTSAVYLDAWKAFLQKSSASQMETSPMFCQYVGHQLFLLLIKSSCTFTTNNGNCEIPLELSDEEIQALRYTAGYIPRSLKKKILKSSRDPEQQQDLVLCLDDLLSDGTEEPSESEEWLTALNRGGLLCVNNMTFELFYSMELEFRRHIGAEEYGVRLEKAILRDSELLSEVNNAFCNSHPLLAQKVVTRSARAAVSKISADALLAKALSVRRSQAGSLLKTIRKVNAKKLQESDILVGHRFHTAGAEPYFFDNSYTHTKQHGAIPVDLNGRCVVAEEIKDRDKVTMRPLKWKCTNECRKLTSEEVAIVLKTNSLFQKSIEDLRAGLDALDSGCGHVHYDVTLKSHSGFIDQFGHPIYSTATAARSSAAPLPSAASSSSSTVPTASSSRAAPTTSSSSSRAAPPPAAELPPPAVAAGLPPPPPAEAAERPPPLPALAPPPAPIPVPPPPLCLLPPWPLPPPPTWLPWPQRGRWAHRRRGGRGQGRTVNYTIIHIYCPNNDSHYGLVLHRLFHVALFLLFVLYLSHLVLYLLVLCHLGLVLDVAKVVLDVAKVVLDVGKVVLDVAKVVLDVAKVVLDVAKVVLHVAKVVLDVAKVVLDVAKVVLDVAKVVLYVGKVVLDVAKVVLDVGKVVLDVAKVVLDVAKVVLDVGKVVLDVGKVVLDVGKVVLDVDLRHLPITTAF